MMGQTSHSGDNEQSEPLVESYAGAGYPERPRALVWEEQRLEVDEIERQWRTPDGIGFRVRVHDGRRFILFYTPPTDSWTVQPKE